MLPSDNLRSGYRHEFSDDCLFPLPKDLCTWNGCVRVWNSTLSFQSHWESVLAKVIESGVDGAVTTEAFTLWDRDLPALVARLERARELGDKAFDMGCRIRYGFGIGSVLELPADRSEGRRERVLMYVTGGGLPCVGHEPDVRISIQEVCEFNGGHLTSRGGILFFNGHPDSFMDGALVRDDIKPVKPGDSPVHWLPLEVFDDELMKTLRSRIDPKGLSSDRRSVLLSFWEQTLWIQKVASWPFTNGDIIRVNGRGKRGFHVVYAGGHKDKYLSCYNPKSKSGKKLDVIELLSLSDLSYRSNKFELALRVSDFASDGIKMSSTVGMVLAMIETTRMRDVDRRS